MVRTKYTDKIMKVIEMRDEGFPTANTRIEVSKLLKKFFMEQMAVYAENVAAAQMAIEDNVKAIETGRSL